MTWHGAADTSCNPRNSYEVLEKNSPSESNQALNQFAQRCCGFVILRNISFLPGLKPWAAWSDSKISPIFTLKWPFWPKLLCESVKMTKNLKQTFATLAVFSCQATGKAEATEIYSQKKNNTKILFLNTFYHKKNIFFFSFESNNGSKSFLRCKWSKLPRDLLLFLSIYSLDTLPTKTPMY